MQSNTSNSYNRFDIFEAPPITDDLRLSILSEGKVYAWNIVSLSTYGACWDLRIISIRKNKNIILSFEEKIPLPDNFKIWLLDKEDKFSVPIINKSAIINMKEKGVRLLKLIVGTENYAQEVSGNISLLPSEYLLFQNFPNPFNPETSIYYTLRDNSIVTIEIFDILGRKIKNLLDEEFQNAGLHFVKWDGTDINSSKVSSGIYIYRIKASDFINSKKMILLK
jgi:hypothetical protein